MLGVANLLLAIDKLLKMEESQNTDETESALEALGLIGTSKFMRPLPFCYTIMKYSSIIGVGYLLETYVIILTKRTVYLALLV
jgi:hypothetical protein